MNHKNFNKNFNNLDTSFDSMSKTMNTGFKAAAVASLVGTVGFLAVAGLGLYILGSWLEVF